MNKKRSIALTLLSLIHLASAEQPKFFVDVQVINPQTVTPRELDRHKELAAQVFFSYDTSIQTAGPLKSYYDYFNIFFTAFKEQKNEEFLISAYDSQGHIIGGLFGKALIGPLSVLDIKEEQTAHYLDCVYVDCDLQNKGIATTMINFLITNTSKNKKRTPLFLYVWAINTTARKVYEKCGFTLITDAQHPDGKGTAAAHALQTNSGYNPNDFVVYRKN